MNPPLSESRHPHCLICCLAGVRKATTASGVSGSTSGQGWRARGWATSSPCASSASPTILVSQHPADKCGGLLRFLFRSERYYYTIIITLRFLFTVTFICWISFKLLINVLWQHFLGRRTTFYCFSLWI